MVKTQMPITTNAHFSQKKSDLEKQDSYIYDLLKQAIIAFNNRTPNNVEIAASAPFSAAADLALSSYSISQSNIPHDDYSFLIRDIQKFLSTACAWWTEAEYGSTGYKYDIGSVIGHGIKPGLTITTFHIYGRSALKNTWAATFSELPSRTLSLISHLKDDDKDTTPYHQYVYQHLNVDLIGQAFVESLAKSITSFKLANLIKHYLMPHGLDVLNMAQVNTIESPGITFHSSATIADKLKILTNIRDNKISISEKILLYASEGIIKLISSVIMMKIMIPTIKSIQDGSGTIYAKIIDSDFSKAAYKFILETIQVAKESIAANINDIAAKTSSLSNTFYGSTASLFHKAALDTSQDATTSLENPTDTCPASSNYRELDNLTLYNSQPFSSFDLLPTSLATEFSYEAVYTDSFVI